MKRVMRSLLGGLALAMSVAPGCSDEGSRAEAPRAARATPPSRDLAAVMRRVHFAFRGEGSAFTGGHTTYEARVEEGEIQLAPISRASPISRETKRGAPLVARTEAIGRGPTRARAGRPRLADDGSIEIDHRGAVEHLRNTERGVEQSWTFAEMPRGEGDLTLRVRASGERYVGATALGHHFVDPATGLGVRYGEATWIDARGARSKVGVTFDGEALALSVPRALVETSAYPAELDPIIGPESGVDDPVIVPAPSGRYTPAIAWGPGAALAVWADWRQSITDLYAARIAADGTVLDPTGIPVCTFSGVQSEPAVASNGTGWLVAWSDGRGSSSEIYGARVDATGVVLDPNGKKLQPSNSFYGNRPAIASNGTDYLVAWDDSFNGFDTNASVRATRVSSAGVVLDPNAILVAGAANGQIDPAIAWNGSHYFVVWSDQRAASNYQMYGARVSAGGVVLDAAGLPINTTETYGERRASIASDGSGFFVAWNVSFSSSGGDAGDKVMGARLDPNGVPLDPSGLLLGTTYADNPRVAFGGGQYAVTWNRILSPDYTVHAALVAPSTGAITPPASVTPVVSPNVNNPTQTHADITWDGADFLVAWADTRTATEIYAARLDTSLASRDGSGFLVSRAASTEQSAAVAYNGASYLVAWEDERAATTEIWAARVDTNGVTLDPSGIHVAGTVGDRKGPAVASDGDGFFIAWQDSRNGNEDIYGTPVTAAGAVVAPTGVPISTHPNTQQTPVVTFDGTQYLTAWSDGRGGTWDIYGARVTAAGAVLDPYGFVIYGGAGTQLDPAIASNGSGSLVAWSDLRSGGYDVYAARVSPSGVVLDPASFGVATTLGNESIPTLASNGVDYLAIFQLNGDLRATRVLATGAPTAPLAFAVSTAAGTQQNAAAMFDGASYVVAWDDGTDTRGARVSVAGALLDATGFAISSGSTSPAIAAGPHRRGLVAYHRFDPTAPSGAQRVRKRTYDDRLSLGVACSIAGDCLSGACVDGVCCASSCAAACMACSLAKTGVASGTCAPIKDGTDPDGECPADALSCTTAACVAGACAQVVAANACAIGGACWASGAAAPGNDCATCAPAQSSTAFTPKPDGTACATDGLACTVDACSAGACAHTLAAGQCLIDGVCVAAGATSPFDPCRACDPTVSATAWSVRPDGSACTDDGVSCTIDACNAGVCAHTLAVGECLIDGACVAAGATDPFDPCRACDASQSASAWSDKPDGSACTDDGLACTTDVCQAGLCAHTIAPASCLIAGSCFAAGATSPSDDCAACDPAASATVWSPKPDGAACSPDAKTCTLDVCQAGACAHPQAPSTCLIAGVCWASGDKDPASPCDRCDPAASATSWTPIAGCGADAGTGGSGGATTSTASQGGAGTGGSGGAGTGGATTSTGGQGGAISTGSGGAKACVPGAQIACSCDSGLEGVQACAADGSAFGACDCPPPPSSTGGGATAGKPPQDTGGCGCDLPGSPHGSRGAGLLVIALVALSSRRRKRR